MTYSIREAVAYFDSEKELEAAIDALLSRGFDRSEISLLANVETVEKSLGSFFDKVSELEDNQKVPHVAYVAREDIGDAEGAVIGGLMYVGALIGLIPVVVSGGTLAAAITAAAISGGVGTAIGSILASYIGHQHSDYISKQLEHGGLLLWVRTFTAEDEKIAIEILSEHSGKDVHIHGLPEIHNELEDRYLGTVKNAEGLSYKGASIIRADTGTYYASGKVFINEAEAKAYIDRVVHLDALYTASQRSGIDMKAAMTDPALIFQAPVNITKSIWPVRDKIELLRRWAYNEKELEMASDDGMEPPNGGDRLQEIEILIEALENESA